MQKDPDNESGSSSLDEAARCLSLSAAGSPSAATTPAPVVCAGASASARPCSSGERRTAGMYHRGSIHTVEVWLVRLVDLDTAAILFEVVSALDQDRALIRARLALVELIARR